jgi:hypothetical protein
LFLLPHNEFDNNEDDTDGSTHRNPHDARDWHITLAAYFLLLPISRLYYFLGDKIMNLKEALIYVVWVLAATIVGRNVLISRVALRIWGDEFCSEAMLIALCGIVASVGVLPISFRYLSHVMFVKNFNVFCLLMSCLFLFLQQIWGVTPRGMGRSWFTLLLNNVAVLSVLALPVSIATRLIQIQASVTIRTVVGLIEGFLIGMLLPQFFPKQVDSTSWFLCLVLIVLCQLVSIFVLFTIWPSSHSSEWLPKVYAAIWALAPILYFAEEFHTISSFEGMAFDFCFRWKLHIIHVYLRRQ